MKVRVVGPSGTAMLRILETEGAFERMRGLLGRAPLAAGEAMVIGSCNLVHTVGMRYPIDIVFVDRAGVVLNVCAAVAPARVRGCLRASKVIELAGGEAARRGWQRGERLSFLGPAAAP